jgi:hypothetical protein
MHKLPIKKTLSNNDVENLKETLDSKYDPSMENTWTFEIYPREVHN